MHLKIKGEFPHFWQWDLDRQLIVDDAACGEVHFCNGTTESAPVCEVYEKDGLRLVDVPNVLLQSANTLTAYMCAGECQTKHQQSFRVLPRTKPADYVYTETEVKSWAALDERVRALEENGGGGGAVASVNGMTGAVRLTAEDVGALPKDTLIPGRTSQLENDSGFITADDIPESSGASEMELIHTGSVGEDGALSYLIDKDMGGNPFSLSEFELEYTINRPEDKSPPVNMGAYSFNGFLKSSFSTNGSSGDSYLLVHGDNSNRDTTKPSYYRVVYRGKIVDGILYMKAFATGYAYDAEGNQVLLTGNAGSFVVGKWNDIVSKGALFPDGLTSINIAYYYKTLMNANITLRGVKNV